MSQLKTTKEVQVAKQPTLEEKQYDKMYDSEYLALLFAKVVKENNTFISDYTFKRIDKILHELARQEMN